VSSEPNHRRSARHTGIVLVEYSSLTLLLAIAAIAVLVQVGEVGVPQSDAVKVTVGD